MMKLFCKHAWVFLRVAKVPTDIPGLWHKEVVAGCPKCNKIKRFSSTKWTLISGNYQRIKKISKLTDMELKELCWHSIDAFEEYAYTKRLADSELRKRYPDLSAQQLNRKRKQLGESYFNKATKES